MMVWGIAGQYAYGGTADGTPLRWDLGAGTVTSLERIADIGAKTGSVDGDALVVGDPAGATTRRVAVDGTVDELRGPGGELAVAFAMSADGRTIAGVIAPAEFPMVWRC
ncbi:hypothetical protein ABT369_17210 [Dactylosporangium sp. NPDC000244]|uniref:hypothetical protein n=1 Tax=Dactylosporangium sp. NPDC000244 TaxID=3154365 RepID=UPI00331817FF